MPPTAPAISPVKRWATNATDTQLNAFSGAVSGLASGIFTCPLDVIKIRLQAQGSLVPTHAYAALKSQSRAHHELYSGLFKTARIIWRGEGLHGMYRGIGPLVLGYLPTWAIWFTVYQQSKVIIRQSYPSLSSSPNTVNMISSIAAGFASTVATNPIWTVKVRLMSQAYRPCRNRLFQRRRAYRPHWHYHSTLDAAYKMYMTEGMGAFYSGLRASLLGLSHVAIQFPAYEYLKMQFTGKAMGASRSDGDDGAEWIGILSASLLSKMVASCVTYPHEVIRTRLQTQRRPVPGAEFLEGLGGFNGLRNAGLSNVLLQPKYRGVVHAFRLILREEGWRVLYNGMGVNMARSLPAATVTMLTYEYVMSSLSRIKEAAVEGEFGEGGKALRAGG
ncbi:mitochondrial carrier domain-containing protein [Dactylonectria macrodidyma]|uniref:Mitochondrial carrier domain-containing protein n=1 Tax=Dactylonectria macrodidyma TaxID=307937 RepID=A0A9P9F7H9_9HYPO|nr:mitochondrial carrier domain-containing protein [Dactylonectria macrodidyma]